MDNCYRVLRARHARPMPRPTRRDACLAELARLGGACEAAALVIASSRATVRACLAAGELVSLGGGWMACPESVRLLSTPPKAPAWHLAPEAWPDSWRQLLRARRAVAASRRAALAHRCAALDRGWGVWHEPPATELAVPQGRKRREARRAHGQVIVVRRSLSARELADGVTGPLRTVLDCAAALPFSDALAIADSALRSGDVGPLELLEAGEGRRTGGGVARVAREASVLPANPFESALRALLLDVQGASFAPQVEICTAAGAARVDLADVDLRIAVEADSYLFHGSREGFTRDLRRYNELSALGWTVIRVGFDDASKRPEAVKAQVQQAVWNRREARSAIWTT